MSDFILDLRPGQGRASSRTAVDKLRFYPDIRASVYELGDFTLVQTRADDWALWGPYLDDKKSMAVALTGRIALEASEWEAARSVPGSGGLACKAIYQAYQARGAKGLEELNGNFVVVVYDGPRKVIHVVNDRCGMQPCYEALPRSGGRVLGSHPDVTASVSGLGDDLDQISLSEFLVSGKVHYPHTYYTRIKALPSAERISYSFNSDGINDVTHHEYFSLKFTLDNSASQQDLTESLCLAFRNAVRKRTLPIFGQAAVSLSGGLDSRMVLCSAPNPSDLWAFSFHDKENYELSTARAVAKAANVRFIPLRRSPDFYAETAEQSVRISGATGNLFTNHHLGFRSHFREMGIDNSLSAFFCDRFFKGYSLDKRDDRLLRRHSLAPFTLDHDQPYYWFVTPLAMAVRERYEDRFPETLKSDDSEEARLAVEAKRIFPLHAVLDNVSMAVPERTMGWYMPTVDNDLLDMYLRIPLKSKLDSVLYSKAVERQCGPRIACIPNANTGVRVGATYLERLAGSQMRALTRRLMSSQLRSDGSWPNWNYYLSNSVKVNELWGRRPAEAVELFDKIMGPGYSDLSPKAYAQAGQEKLFFRVLTLSVWMEQRLT